MNKEKIILIIINIVLTSILALIVYAVYCDVTGPQKAPVEHMSYPVCEYRTVKGACGSWVTKNH